MLSAALGEAGLSCDAVGQVYSVHFWLRDFQPTMGLSGHNPIVGQGRSIMG